MNYSFRKFQPLSLRLWHWLNAIVILALLGTVVLRKTLLSWRANSVIIQDKLSAAGTTISSDLAKDIAVSIRNPLWDLHVYLGFALAALLICRLMIMFFVEKEWPGINAVKLVLGIKKVSQKDHTRAVHYALVKTGYAAFYVATLVMVVTGLILNFEDALGIGESFADFLKETHEITMWYFVLFAVGHVAGVTLTETKSEPGLVSDMINGGKRNP